MAKAHKKRFLSGTQPLWKAFWILYFAGGIAFTVAALFLLKVASSQRPFSEAANSIDVSTEYFLVSVIAAITSVYIFYFIYCFISILRCAKNSSSKWASVAAKFIVVVNACWILYKLPASLASLTNYF